MSTERPQIGELSADGQLRWDGTQWTPLARGRREPTSWTLPLRRIVAAYLVLLGVSQVLLYLLFTSVTSLEKSIRASGEQFIGNEVHTAATVGYASGLVVVGIIAAVLLLLAAGSFLGWRWAFWVDVFVLALVSISVVSNVNALLSSATQQVPRPWIAVSLLLSVLGFALLLWLAVAAARFGTWGMRRSGAG